MGNGLMSYRLAITCRVFVGSCALLSPARPFVLKPFRPYPPWRQWDSVFLGFSRDGFHWSRPVMPDGKHRVFLPMDDRPGDACTVAAPFVRMVVAQGAPSHQPWISSSVDKEL